MLKAPLRPFKVYGHAIIVDDMIVGGLELFSSLEMILTEIGHKVVGGSQIIMVDNLCFLVARLHRKRVELDLTK